MPYSLERLPDLPVILYTQLPGGSVLDDWALLVAESRSLLDAQVEPVFIVNDLRQLKISLDEMLRSASSSARGDQALLHHPNIRENLYVITDPTIRMAINGLASATFGRVRLHCFDTVEEAMDYCRANISDGSAA